MRTLIIQFCTLTLLGILPVSVYPHDQETLFNKVNLQANAEREIPNDEMRVVMVTEHQGSKPDQLADLINKDMRWALNESKKFKSIMSSTRSYRTNPIYKNRIITAWQASQELELNGRDFSDITKLVNELQGKLQVRQMTFNPTSESRKAYENELIEDAMKAFKERIEIVKKQMEQKDYRIIDINIQTNNQALPPMRFTQQAEMSVMSRAAPAVEAGTSKIVVTVSGSVQFY
jgi:predicted secreted protein